MGTLLKPMARPSELTALPAVAQPASVPAARGPKRPATAAANPPRTNTRRFGSDTSWIVGLVDGLESSICA